MKILIVYDSVFGNTEKIALEIGKSLLRYGEVRSLKAKDVRPESLEGVDRVIVGSPTRKFRPTPQIVRFLAGLAGDGLKGVKGAAFDTRVDTASIKSPILRFIVNTAGYAAGPIAARMKRAGAEVTIEPAGFCVEGTEGPLKEGELARAARWAERIAEQAGAEQAG